MDDPPARRAPIRRTLGCLAAFSVAVGSVGCAAAEEHDPLMETARSVFGILEPVAGELLEAPDVALGRKLFWDERISADGATACASCHTAEAWGSDPRPFSVDARGDLTARHSQTVFNATRQPSLRWVGDRRDAAHQAERSLAGSMGLTNAEDVVPLLMEHGYEGAFLTAFPQDPDPVSPANYGRALQAYQSTLITPARFDAYLAGNAGALSTEEKEGLELFLSNGCVGCHSGELLGGGVLQRFGITGDYWIATGSEKIDPGLYQATEEEGDRYVFRVSMLRNIAKTAPYFHDGSVATLAEAVAVMANVQLGRTLSEADVARIVAFLGSLTGEIPEDYSAPDR